MVENTVIVYPPEGPPERHSRANARDLVNGANYTWQPGVKTTPAAYAPFAAVRAPDGPQPSQSVLDSVGSNSSAGTSSAAAGAAAAQAAQQEQIAAALAAQQAAPAPVAEVVDFSAPTVDASDLDDDADAEAEPEAEAAVEAEPAAETEDAPAAPRGRGRPRRA